MKQIAITNEKQILTGIKKAFDAMESAKRNYVVSVIGLGERLIEAKKLVPHGHWESWIKTHSECAFGYRQAQKYMQVAANKLLVLEYMSNEQTIDNLTKAISDASPEQLARVEELKRIEQEKAQQAEAEKQRRSQELEAKRQEEQIINQVQTKEPEAIDAEFTEVKHEPKKPEPKDEAPKVDESEVQELKEELSELKSVASTISKDNESLCKIFESDDKLETAAKEIKRLNDLNTMLEGRLNTFMNERNALIKEAKYWRSKFEKLEKANGK